MLPTNSKSSEGDSVGVPSSGLMPSTSLSKRHKKRATTGGLFGSHPPMLSDHDDVDRWSIDEPTKGKRGRRRDKNTSVKKAGLSSEQTDSFDKAFGNLGSKADGDFIKWDHPVYKNPFDDSPQSAQKPKSQRAHEPSSKETLNTSPFDSTHHEYLPPPIPKSIQRTLSSSSTSQSLSNDSPHYNAREDRSIEVLPALQRPAREGITTETCPHPSPFSPSTFEDWDHSQGSQVGHEKSALETQVDAPYSASVQPESGSNHADSRPEDVTLTNQHAALSMEG
ncbi:hypothetical protein FRC03_001743, partial [Tulasnella sp. 419]